MTRIHLVWSQENLDVLEKYGVLAEEPGSKGAQVSVTVVSTEKQKNELKQAAATLDDCTAKFKKAIKGDCSGSPTLLLINYVYTSEPCKCALHFGLSDSSEVSL